MACQQVHVLQPVPLGLAVDQSIAVLPGVDEAGWAALRLRRDQVVVQTPLPAVGRRAAIQVEAALAQLAGGLPGDQADATLNLGIEGGQPRLRRVIEQQIALIQGLNGAIVARHNAGKLSDLFGRHFDGRLHHRP